MRKMLRNDERVPLRLRLRWAALPVTLVLLALTACMLYFSCGSVHGSFSIDSKQEEHGHYFLQITYRDNYVNLPCDKATFDEAICDPDLAYDISFIYHSLLPSFCWDVEIDLDDVLDNRNHEWPTI